MRSRKFWIAVGLCGFFSLAPSIPGLMKAANAQLTSQQLLEQLIEGARREGRLRVTAVSGLGARGARELADAYKRRFELDIEVEVNRSAGERAVAFQVIAAHKAGTRPSHDVMNFTEEAVLLLKNAGAAKRIENWRLILAEIDPKTYKIGGGFSPYPFDGYGFTWSTRTHALLYNPKLISRERLPRTMKEYGNPRHKGMFSVPPHITRAMVGPVVYARDEWLKIVRGWRQNAAHVATFSEGVSRLLRGELAFLYGNAYQYFAEKANDPAAPIGVSFFEDLPWVHLVLNAVLEGTRSPNAAKLYALWSMSEEASQLYEKYAYTPNLVFGTGPIARDTIRLFRERNVNPITWFDNPKTLGVFLWYGTKEGIDYAKLLERAQREGR